MTSIFVITPDDAPHELLSLPLPFACQVAIQFHNFRLELQNSALFVLGWLFDARRFLFLLEFI